jgi:hypothetical protein
MNFRSVLTGGFPALMGVLAICVTVSCVFAADGIIDCDGVEGMQFHRISTNVVLAWPSNPRETFTVLWRTNTALETPWTELTNQLHAAASTNETIFCDLGALTRVVAMRTNANLDDVYRVFLIPDFWVNLEGITMTGGPQNPGEDFLPLYLGLTNVDFFMPETSVYVDGEDFPTGPKEIQRVNIGTTKKPEWIYATGYWLHHDMLTNGEHTINLHTLFTLNNFVGQYTWYLTVTNQPVHIRVTNAISFVGSYPTVEGPFVAQSAQHRMNWRIDVYNARSRILARKTGQTLDGNIEWKWNMRDDQGRLHNNFEEDSFFKPWIQVWPLGDQPKGAQLLAERPQAWDYHDYWNERLGHHFVKQQLSAEEYRKRMIKDEPSPHQSQVPPRPLSLPAHPNGQEP